MTQIQESPSHSQLSEHLHTNGKQLNSPEADETFIINGSDAISLTNSSSHLKDFEIKDNNNNNNINDNNQTLLHTNSYTQLHTSKIEGRKIHGGNGNITPINIEKFFVPKKKQPGLRANVFVSKECTQSLADYIVDEYWGRDQGMLYKYLDYIFRCQIFDEQVKKITYKLNDNIQQILIFHTGLQRKSDIEFLYFILIENDADKRHAEQKWRVPSGHIKESCMTASEVIKYYKIESKLLPKRIKFYNNLNELLFEDTFKVEVNWQERLRTNKERIYTELGLRNFKDKMFTNDSSIGNVPDLVDAFSIALKKSVNKARANPRLAVAQGFVETKHYKYRVELLLPLIVEYPKNKFYNFALALRQSDPKKKIYVGMSLLTMEMAYANARLVGYVDSCWLANENQKNDLLHTPNISKMRKMSSSDSLSRHYVTTPTSSHSHGQTFNVINSNNNNNNNNIGYQYMPNYMDIKHRSSRYVVRGGQTHHHSMNITPNYSRQLNVSQSQPFLYAYAQQQQQIQQQHQQQHQQQQQQIQQQYIQQQQQLQQQKIIEQQKIIKPIETIKPQRVDSFNVHTYNTTPNFGKNTVNNNNVNNDDSKSEQVDDGEIENLVDDMINNDNDDDENNKNKNPLIPKSKQEKYIEINKKPKKIENFLLLITRLPSDSSVLTIRRFMEMFGKLLSVHYVDEDKMTVIKFAHKNERDAALKRVLDTSKYTRMTAEAKYEWKYLNMPDKTVIWEYKDSILWKTHCQDFGTAINQVPPGKIAQIGNYTVHKFSNNQGIQINCRTGNKRAIRRIHIDVWDCNPHAHYVPLSSPLLDRQNRHDNFFFPGLAGTTLTNTPPQTNNKQLSYLVLNSSKKPTINLNANAIAFEPTLISNIVSNDVPPLPTQQSLTQPLTQPLTQNIKIKLPSWAKSSININSNIGKRIAKKLGTNNFNLYVPNQYINSVPKDVRIDGAFRKIDMLWFLETEPLVILKGFTNSLMHKDPKPKRTGFELFTDPTIACNSLILENNDMLIYFIICEAWLSNDEYDKLFMKTSAYVGDKNQLYPRINMKYICTLNKKSMNEFR